MGTAVRAKDAAFKRTAMHSVDSVEVCQLLLDHGADVNARDSLGMTPLHCAATHGSLAICKLLLSHGADVRAVSGSGRTSLHAAADEGQFAVCELLLEKGADLDAIDAGGEVPLHEAAKRNHLEVCRLLVGRGANPSFIPDPPDPNFYLTPLQKAVKSGCLDTIRYFIFECGEDPGQSTLSGKSLTELARDPRTLQLLLSMKTEVAIRGTLSDNGPMDVAATPRRVGGMSPI